MGDGSGKARGKETMSGLNPVLVAKMYWIREETRVGSVDRGLSSSMEKTAARSRFLAQLLAWQARMG